MTSLDLPARSGAASLRLALPAFAATLFLSAFLLFSVQPMFAKMVLPILGGAPAVWSVAMVFFQTVLLAGYAYAHLLARLRSTRTAAGVHMVTMGLAFLALPIGLAEMARTPPEEAEALWLLGVFGLSVGLPFFAVSANGPLLQAWFARSGHPQARDPYFLYGASNVGSFVALLAYPLAIEPLLTLGAQSLGWTAGFLLLGVAIAGCAALVAAREETGEAPAAEAGEAPGWGRRASWIALAAVPSGLLVSVTAHISTDVASAPLLWVLPLALFLATFVLVFRERPLVSASTLSVAQIVFVGLAAALWAADLRNIWLTLGVHLGLFFTAAMACHDALYARRPAPGRLTEFYMLMSLGGVVGGVFCGLVAPNLFSSVVEYPLFVVASLFCSAPAIAALRAASPRAPLVSLLPQSRLGLYGLAAAMVGLSALTFFSSTPGPALGAAAFAAFALVARAPRAAAWLGAAALVMAGVSGLLRETTQTHRSFFGVHKVVEIDGRYRLLMHGTTIHGAQRIADAEGKPLAQRPEPLTYYTDAGPIAEAMRAVRGARGGKLERASLVGLGSGSLACQMRRGERFAFYEIDPVVARLAQDRTKFGFLDACGQGEPIVLGDARLTLERAAPGAQALVVDAFSSDAIPAHLLTKEAFAGYLRHLDARGVVILHVTNRHFDLSRIIARTAAELGLTTWFRADVAPKESFTETFRASSSVAVLARDPEHVGVIAAAQDRRWTKLDPAADVAPWTDDYSNILQAMADKWRR